MAALGTQGTNVPPGLGNVTALAARGWHDLALRDDGTVFAWGSNNFGESSVPEGLANVTQISAGTHFSLALKADGTVVAWGAKNNPGYAPVDRGQTAVPEGLSNVVEIAAGDAHSLARTRDGRIVAWGSGLTAANGVPEGLSNVVALAAGSGYSLALKSDATVVYWTTSEDAQTLPESNIVGIAADYCGALLRADGAVLAIGDCAWPQTVKQAATDVAAMARGRFLLAIRPDGSLFSEYFPPPPADLTNVVGVAAGENHALALVGDGRPTRLAATFPRTAFMGQKVILNARVAGAPPLSYKWFQNGQPITGATNAVLDLGNVGLNHSGSYGVTVANLLGSITFTNANLAVTESPPLMIEGPVDVVGYPGGQASFAVRANGSLPLTYQWFFQGEPIPSATNSTLLLENTPLGSAGLYRVEIGNAFGRLESGDATLSLGPWIAMGKAADPYIHCRRLPAFAPPDAQDVVATACGLYHTVGLRRDGTVTSWGYGDNWCGDHPPVEVPPGISNIVSVAAGHYHSLGLKENGTLVAWGELGQGGMHTPPPLSNVVAVAARQMLNAALLADGRVVTWGEPADVPADLTNAVAIAAGNHTVFALTRNQTVVAIARGASYWHARNLDLTNVVGIAAGYHHLVALHGDGNVTVRAPSSFGGTNTPPEVTNIVAIAAGLYNTLALRADGTVVAWGDEGPNPPPNLSNVRSISAGDYQAIARVGETESRFGAPIRLRTPLFDGERFALQVETYPGAVYLLEHTDSLVLPNWVRTKSLILGDGTPKALTAAAPLHGQQFYRVRLVNSGI